MIKTYNQIIQNLKEENFTKIYLLMGEEAFFINKISNFFEKNFISEEHRGFNLEIHYGIDSNIETIINSSKSFPMMSDKKLIIVKEGKELDVFKKPNNSKIDLLVNYLNNINSSTTLIFCLNNKSLDKRSKLFKTFLEVSTVLDSSSKENKIYDNQIPNFISNEVKRNKFNIDEEATILLSESIGNNLEKIVNALHKIFANKDDKNIKTEDVIKSIGINREYNLFEFQDSLAEKNSLKCGKIVNYFSSNEKKFPIQQLIVYMFNFFSRLLVVKTKKLSDPNNISSLISVHPYVARSYVKASNNYKLNEIVNIINAIKNLDLISKGIKQIKSGNKNLMGEMIFKIFYNK
ncbi:MAG: DNA polymerase III subunit delta [Cytophagales bacterium]